MTPSPRLFRFPALLARALGLLCCAAIPIAAGATENPGEVVRDIRIAASSDTVWQGWGTSLAWFAKVYGDRDDVADLLFTTRMIRIEGETLPGLGLNIARYNAGACSWNEVDGRRMAVSPNIRPFRQIEGFWLDGKNADPNSAGWDWTVDAKQRALLLKARDRGADRFELFSNSPMWWMCRNGNPSGADNGALDNLAPENYPAFATYLATIAARAKSHWGVAFTSIEPFNEPVTNYWHAQGKQEGCHFDAASQAAFLPMLRAELDRRGLQDLPLVTSDESHYDDALRTWRAWPPEAKALVRRFNVHGYSLAKGDRAGLHRAVATESGLPIWNSEHGDKFADGLEMARNIHRDMAALHPVAWCYWQPFDGGNQGGWGLVSADLDRGIIGKANPKYFVFAHYTRHIRPGMRILKCDDAQAIAAYSAVDHMLAVVILNDGPEVDARVDLSAFSLRDGPVTALRTTPLSDLRYAPLPGLRVRSGIIEARLPADSVQTFVVGGVAER